MPGSGAGGFAEAARGQERLVFTVTGPADPALSLAVTSAVTITRTLRYGRMGNLSPRPREAADVWCWPYAVKAPAAASGKTPPARSRTGRPAGSAIARKIFSSGESRAR